MDFQLSMNEQLMERIFRLYALLRRGPGLGLGGEGEKGGRPSAQNRILLMLGESDGISQRDMTTLLRLRPQSVSETISKLEAAGLVERRQSERDKRIFNIFLTDDGRERVSDLLQDRPDFAAMFLSPLSDEEKLQLTELLGKLVGPAHPNGDDFGADDFMIYDEERDESVS